MTPEKIHLIMFMGQSNMAGRGTAEQAPAVPMVPDMNTVPLPPRIVCSL